MGHKDVQRKTDSTKTWSIKGTRSQLCAWTMAPLCATSNKSWKVVGDGFFKLKTSFTTTGGKLVKQHGKKGTSHTPLHAGLSD